MKRWTSFLALLACLICTPALAQTPPFYFDVYVTGPSGGSAGYTPAQVASSLTTALIPPIADQSYPCNTSGASATPNNVCSVPAQFSVGTPNSRTLSLSTAYQATTTTKAASVNINITSTASISISGGTTNSATVYIGSTTGVASGTGTPICSYSNSNTGTLTIGLNLSTISAVPCHFDLPAGWYFAILQSSGSVTITSAYDQAMG